MNPLAYEPTGDAARGLALARHRVGHHASDADQP